MSLAAGARLGPYEVQERLGAGGMGKVYRARDTRLDRTVAIKVLPPEFSADPDRRQRFEREARAVAALNHPHICTIHDIGRERPRPAAGEERSGSPAEEIDFLVMECLEGETLAARIARAPLPPAEAVRQILVLLTTLDAVHRRGFVHRDLKPSNVFLTPHGLKLLDFGLARPVAGALDATRLEVTIGGAVAGTPRYMAPEAFQGRPVDARADMFAAGALLFEMLAGRPAFGGETLVDVAHAVVYERAPTLTGSAVIAAVDRVIQRALAKRPEDRYQTADEMARDLRAALAADTDPDLGVSARPVARLIVLPAEPVQGRTPGGRADRRAAAIRTPESPFADWSAAVRALIETRLDDARRLWGRCFEIPQVDPEAQYVLGMCLAYVGDPDRSLTAIDRAITGGFSCFPALVREPWLDPLRGRPEFTRVLKIAEARHRDALAAFVQAGGDRLLGMRSA